MDFEVDISTTDFVENHLLESQEICLNILAEEILKKRGVEPDEEGFYHGDEWIEVIDEFMPDKVDMKPLINELYEQTKLNMLKEVEK
jgi:hypothetical protein